jgi:co-chaperonin GroES (HSP10)
VERKITWKPKGARLIVRKIQEDRKESLIILPNAVKESSRIVEVVEVGTACDAEYLVGEKVLLARYSGYEIPVLDETYTDCMIVNEDEIICFDNANLQGI